MFTGAIARRHAVDDGPRRRCGSPSRVHERRRECRHRASRTSVYVKRWAAVAGDDGGDPHTGYDAAAARFRRHARNGDARECINDFVVGGMSIECLLRIATSFVADVSWSEICWCQTDHWRDSLWQPLYVCGAPRWNLWTDSIEVVYQSGTLNTWQCSRCFLYIKCSLSFIITNTNCMLAV